MVREVELPDGRIAEFPDDMTDKAITDVLKKQFPATTAAAAGGTEFALRLIDNFLGLPQSAGEMLALGGGLAQSLFTLDPNVRQNVREQRKQFPASALLDVPRVTTEDIRAGLEGALGPGTTEEARADIQERTAARREAQPTATGLAQAGADVTSLLALRAPFARRAARQRPAPPQLTELEGSFRRLLRETGRKPAVRRVARGIARAGEAGVEAAFLATLNEGDPLELATVGAGVQLGGSMTLEATKGLLRGSPASVASKLTLAAFATGGIIQLLKSGTPGGEDALIPSIETGFDKVMLTLAVGVSAGLLGAGRLRGTRRAEDLPKLFDAMTAVPRASVLTAIREWQDAPAEARRDIEALMNQLAQDPNVFSRNELGEIQKGLSGKRSMREVIDDLKADESFRRRLAGQPSTTRER